MFEFARNPYFKKTGEWLAVALVLAWCAMLVMSKINLVTADLGRHIQNGSVVLHGSPAERSAVLSTNFYSYTNPDFPFVNHHWGSGAVFYLLYQLGGFNLLSVVYVALTVLTCFIFFRMAQKTAGSVLAVLLAVLILPVATSRREVRPEVFTYLFCGIFYWVLWNYHKLLYHPLAPSYYKRGKTALWILPVLMLLWVNLHIGFIVGIGILGFFWLDEGVRFLRQKRKWEVRDPFIVLSIISALTVIAGTVSPFGLKGLLYPLNIFRNYGYMIVENQSIFFLTRLGRGAGMYFGFFESLVAGVFVTFGLVLARFWKRFPVVNFLIILIFAAMSTLAIRDFPLFGWFVLPIAAYNISLFMPERLHAAYRIAVVVAALSITASVMLKIADDYRGGVWQTFGFGLMPGVQRGAEFYLANKIQGPVFNDYDNGGYLIFNLWKPGEQNIFVDNRPEAYPESFFQEDYIPAQNEAQKFQALDSQYHFNSIFFYLGDGTPWAQTFLIRMVSNPGWAPVYADSYSIIFLKRNNQNAPLIAKYELPKSMFGIK